MPGREVRRARFGPGLWPGPRRQARWVGRGLQRSRAGPEDRFCEAFRNDLRVPLTLEGADPDNARRSGPRRCDILPATGAIGVTLTAWPWCWRARQQDTAGPQAAGHLGCRARPAAASVGPTSEGRERSGPPRDGESPVEPQPVRRVTLAALSLDCSRPIRRFSRPGRQARRAEGAPLKP